MLSVNWDGVNSPQFGWCLIHSKAQSHTRLETELIDIRREDQYVSLKITVADRGGKEVFSYRSYLSDGCAYLVRLHDACTIIDPNGKHDGLVLEVMGPNLSELLHKRPEFQVGEPWERRFTTAFAKRALLDTLKALDFLHQRDVVHGDLHFGNILAFVSSRFRHKQRADYSNRSAKVTLWCVKMVKGISGRHRIFLNRCLFTNTSLMNFNHL